MSPAAADAPGRPARIVHISVQKRCFGAPMTIRASELLNTRIVDHRGEVLGRIRDLDLDKDIPGVVRYVLIEVSATGSMGRRTVAIPWSLIARARQFGRNQGRIRLQLDISRSTLQGLRDIAET